MADLLLQMPFQMFGDAIIIKQRVVYVEEKDDVVRRHDRFSLLAAAAIPIYSTEKTGWPLPAGIELLSHKTIAEAFAPAAAVEQAAEHWGLVGSSADSAAGKC